MWILLIQARDLHAAVVQYQECHPSFHDLLDDLRLLVQGPLPPASQPPGVDHAQCPLDVDTVRSFGVSSDHFSKRFTIQHMYNYWSWFHIRLQVEFLFQCYLFRLCIGVVSLATLMFVVFDKPSLQMSELEEQAESQGGLPPLSDPKLYQTPETFLHFVWAIWFFSTLALSAKCPQPR